MTEDAFNKVKKGIKETAEGIKEGVEDTAEGVKETAREATDTDTYTSSHEETKNRDFNEAGGKEPMNASHEPTAVKRDQDTEIAEEQTGTDSADAKEKYRKKGMTEA